MTDTSIRPNRVTTISGVLGLVGVLACGCAKPACPRLVEQREPLIEAPVEIPGDRPLAVIGDLQETMLGERLIGREQNSQGAEALVCQLGGEGQGATALLGDLVTWGTSDDDWARFDRLAGLIRGHLLPVRGNHDFFGPNGTARGQWLRRFPWFERAPWYSVKWNRIGLVFVESNLGELSAAERAAEQNWYERVLGQFEQDPLVSGIVVLEHHAPFTLNPNAQGGLDQLRKAFIEPLCQHSKVLVMISGHAHGYERYAKPCGGRTIQFVVSGGGGGPRPVTPPCFDDECLASGCCAPSSRPLHYLVLEQQPKGLELTVQAQRTSAENGVVETVWLPFRDEKGVAAVTSSCGRQQANPVTECPWQASE